METDILVTNDILWTVYGACLLPNPSRWIRVASKTTKFIVIFFGSHYIQMSFTYIMVHAGHDEIKNIYYALMQIIYMCTALIPYLMILVQMDNAKAMIRSFRAVVKERWRPETEAIYRRADRSAHFVAKWPSLTMQIFFRLTMILAAAAYFLNDLRRGHIDIAQWYSLHYVETPYNRFSGIGFIVYLVHQSLYQFALLGSQNCCLSLFIGPCFFLDALCTDFRLHFGKMDLLTGRDDNRSRFELKSMVLEAIKLQRNIIELFNELQSVTSSVLFFEMLLGTIFSATFAFQLELALGTFNIHTVMMIAGLFLLLTSILPYCYYASLMIHTINANAVHAYHSNWYLLSIDQQRILQMILAHSQIQRSFTGYKIINCSLEFFLTIMKGSASYVIMLKKFSD